MARQRLPQQQELLSNLLTITRVREHAERLLVHVTRLQAETISLATAYGISQTDLGDVAGLSRQRIGQIADQIDASALSARSIDGQIHQVDGWPGDVMSALTDIQYPADKDDPVRAKAANKQITVVYGKEEASRRAEQRAAFLDSLPTDPERRRAVAQRAQQNSRTVFGVEQG